MNLKLRKYPNLIDNLGYLNLQAKIKIALFCTLLHWAKIGFVSRIDPEINSG